MVRSARQVTTHCAATSLAYLSLCGLSPHPAIAFASILTTGGLLLLRARDLDDGEMAGAFQELLLPRGADPVLPGDLVRPDQPLRGAFLMRLHLEQLTDDGIRELECENTELGSLMREQAQRAMQPIKLQLVDSRAVRAA